MLKWNLKAEEIVKRQTGSKFPSKPFRLKTAFQRGKKVYCKYLIFTAVNQHVTVLFGQVFYFLFLMLVRSWKSCLCCDRKLSSSNSSVYPTKTCNIFFFKSFMTYWTLSMSSIQCVQYFFFCVTEHILWFFLSPAIKRYHMYELWIDC